MGKSGVTTEVGKKLSFWIFICLAVGIVLESEVRAETTCDPAGFTASTPPYRHATRAPQFQNRCVAPEGTAALVTNKNCALIDQDPMRSCAYKKSGSPSTILPDAATISAAMYNAPTAAIQVFMQRYSAEICGGGVIEQKVENYKQAVNAVAGSDSADIYKKLTSTDATIKTMSQNAVTAAADRLKAITDEINGTTNGITPTSSLSSEALMKKTIAYCSTNAPSATDYLSQYTGTTAKTTLQENNGFFVKKGEKIIYTPCAASARADALDMQTDVTLNFATIGTCLSTLGYSTTAKIPADKIKVINIQASSSSLNNTGSAYCKKEFEELSRARARSAGSYLRTYLSSYMTTADLDRVIPAGIASAACAVKTGKTELSCGGTNGDGTSGPCAYTGTLAQGAGTTWIFTETRDTANAPATDLLKAQNIHVSIDVGPAADGPSSAGVILYAKHLCKQLRLTCH